MKKLIFILTLLAFWGCEENPVSTESVEIDWILIKNPEFIDVRGEYIGGEEITTTYTGIGYTFFGTNTITNYNMPDYQQEDFDGILNFQYESVLYSFDLSDSYNQEAERYFITSSETPEEINKIICYDGMSYCHIFFQVAYGYVLDLTSPFEIIDYR